MNGKPDYTAKMEDDNTLWVIERGDDQVSRWQIYMNSSGLIEATRPNQPTVSMTFEGRDALRTRWPDDIVAAVIERVGTAKRPDGEEGEIVG